MATSIERIQAPSGGLNTDASPDYVPATQAPVLVNLMPGFDGRAVMRGPIRRGFFSLSTTSTLPGALWTFGDTALLRVALPTLKFYKLDVAAQTSTDVTASLAKTPKAGVTGDPIQTIYARYGDSVYGAIDDANAPALGKWDGNTTIALQTNAPFQFTDIQVHAQRLFVLGGSVPGTTTPAKPRSLFYSDPNPAADLTLLASWSDDVSTLVNQLVIDGDDTPVALAGCGKYMAILGSRSINILTGSGSSSFSIRNLSRSIGCTSRASVVEVDDGFYFMSDVGYCYCDGSTITNLSAHSVSYDHSLLLSSVGNGITASMLNNGYLALTSTVGLGCWLLHVERRTWTQITCFGQAPTAAFRTNSYPLLWTASRKLVLADQVTQVFQSADDGRDSDGSVDSAIPVTWRSRFTRLSGPSSVATVQRVLLDYRFSLLSGLEPNGFRVRILDTLDAELMDEVVPAAPNQSERRQRAQFECFGEADAVYLEVTIGSTSVPALWFAEVYDAYIEYAPAQNRSNV